MLLLNIELVPKRFFLSSSLYYQPFSKEEVPASSRKYCGCRCGCRSICRPKSSVLVGYTYVRQKQKPRQQQKTLPNHERYLSHTLASYPVSLLRDGDLRFSRVHPEKVTNVPRDHLFLQNLPEQGFIKFCGICHPDR